MKTLGTLIAGAILIAVTVSPAHAQQSATPPGPHHPAVPPAPDSAPPPPGGPPMAHGGMPMMEMCRQMMGGGMMGMPMMGGMTSQDPKERAAMLEMHAEMMRAMGDIMMKHARRMQGMTGTAPTPR